MRRVAQILPTGPLLGSMWDRLIKGGLIEKANFNLNYIFSISKCGTRSRNFLSCTEMLIVLSWLVEVKGGGLYIGIIHFIVPEKY